MRCSGGNIRSYLIRERQRISLSVYDRSSSTQRISRFEVRKQMKQRSAQRVDVATRISSLALNLFQRRVIRRISVDAGRRSHRSHLARRSFRQSKIEQHNLAAGSELQILRLDVSMNNLGILRVQVIKRVAVFIRPTQDVLFGNSSSSLCNL